MLESNTENWHNVVDTCRRVIKDFADSVFPAQSQPYGDLVVTDERYLNRIRAFIRQSIASQRQRQQTSAVLDLLGELMARTDNLASRSVHADKISRFEAERVLIYTYLSISDVLVLTGMTTRNDASTNKISLNEATMDELRSQLRLPRNVADELIRNRRLRRLESWEAVAEIKGIGPVLLTRLREEAFL